MVKFTTEVNSNLAKPALHFSGGLAKFKLKTLVKQATRGKHSNEIEKRGFSFLHYIYAIEDH